MKHVEMETQIWHNQKVESVAVPERLDAETWPEWSLSSGSGQAQTAAFRSNRAVLAIDTHL